MLGYADFVDTDNRRLQAFEAQALTKCTIALFTREHAATMLEKLDPPTLLRFIVQMNTAWSSVACWFAETLGYSFRDRLYATLKDLATRFGIQDTRGTLLPIKLSHQDLAEMINASRAMVTKLIGDMIEERLLDREGRHYIVRSGELMNVSVNATTNGHTNAQRNGKRTLGTKLTIPAPTYLANCPRN